MFITDPGTRRDDKPIDGLQRVEIKDGEVKTKSNLMCSNPY